MVTPKSFFNSFLTINSNESKYTVKFTCKTLHEAQKLHRWFLELRKEKRK